eukprot:scaffold52681_cov37-Tisochrysis_lutea.AAC.1
MGQGERGRRQASLPREGVGQLCIVASGPWHAIGHGRRVGRSSSPTATAGEKWREGGARAPPHGSASIKLVTTTNSNLAKMARPFA